ncbi:hypothetical protein P7C70_g7022, partial [Phenoliferia sp. Uapishka_3]
MDSNFDINSLASWPQPQGAWPQPATPTFDAYAQSRTSSSSSPSLASYPTPHPLQHQPPYFTPLPAQSVPSHLPSYEELFLRNASSAGEIGALRAEVTSLKDEVTRLRDRNNILRETSTEVREDRKPNIKMDPEYAFTRSSKMTAEVIKQEGRLSEDAPKTIAERNAYFTTAEALATVQACPAYDKSLEKNDTTRLVSHFRTQEGNPWKKNSEEWKDLLSGARRYRRLLFHGGSHGKQENAELCARLIEMKYPASRGCAPGEMDNKRSQVGAGWIAIAVMKSVCVNGSQSQGRTKVHSGGCVDRKPLAKRAKKPLSGAIASLADMSDVEDTPKSEYLSPIPRASLPPRQAASPSSTKTASIFDDSNSSNNSSSESDSGDENSSVLAPPPVKEIVKPPVQAPPKPRFDGFSLSTLPSSGPAVEGNTMPERDASWIPDPKVVPHPPSDDEDTAPPFEREKSKRGKVCDTLPRNATKADKVPPLQSSGKHGKEKKIRLTATTSKATGKTSKAASKAKIPAPTSPPQNVAPLRQGALAAGSPGKRRRPRQWSSVSLEELKSECRKNGLPLGLRDDMMDALRRCEAGLDV